MGLLEHAKTLKYIPHLFFRVVYGKTEKDVYIMYLANETFSNQKSEAEKAISEYCQRNKEQQLRYPNMIPKYDYKTKKVYCIYEPRSIDDLLKIMVRLPRKVVDINIEKYGYWDQREYVYKKIGLIVPEKKKEKKKTTKNGNSKLQNKIITQMKEFFSFVFDTEANVFVHLLNKETGDTYFQPVGSLKDKVKLTSILNSQRFKRNIDLMYSLSTFKTMKNANQENVFSIPLIQVDVDYRRTPQYRKKLLSKCGNLSLKKKLVTLFLTHQQLNMVIS